MLRACPDETSSSVLLAQVQIIFQWQVIPTDLWLQWLALLTVRIIQAMWSGNVSSVGNMLLHVSLIGKLANVDAAEACTGWLLVWTNTLLAGSHG